MVVGVGGLGVGVGGLGVGVEVVGVGDVRGGTR